MTLKLLEKEIATLEKRLHGLRRKRVGSKTVKISVIDRTAGALKGKLPKDAVAWQRKIRSEWDR
jgi:hypothetical protein